MRVLHVLPTGPTTGGTETYAAMLAASLPSPEFSSDVAMVVDGPVRGDSSIVMRFELAGAGVRLCTPERVAELARGYDLVHIHSWAWWNWMATLPHPKVFTLHFVRALAKAVDADHVIHTAAAVQAMQTGGPPSTHIENAVDLRYFDRARALAAPLPPDVKAFFERAPTLVRVARPIRVDAPLFWDIAERVLRRRPVQLLTVHHDDRDERAVRHLPADLRERVRLEPGTADVAPYLARATVFLYSATGGTDDLVLKEAMALGVPVVATEASGSYSAAEGGLLVPRWAEAAADAALRMLDDPALRERWAQAGRVAVERRLEKLVQAHRDIYAQLVEAHRAQGAA